MSRTLNSWGLLLVCRSLGLVLTFMASVIGRKAASLQPAKCSFSYGVPVTAAWHSCTTATLNTQYKAVGCSRTLVRWGLQGDFKDVCLVNGLCVHRQTRWDSRWSDVIYNSMFRSLSFSV